MNPVLIFGASRGTGFLLAQRLRAADVLVGAMLRAGADAAPLLRLGVQVSRGDAFVPADVAEWGSVTVIVHTRDVILECHAELPRGKMGSGFYNLQSAGPLSGHIRADHCESIYFVRRPFMGKRTLSIHFFNGRRHTMFKVYVGRDAQRNLKADQVQRFDALERRVALREAA